MMASYRHTLQSVPSLGAGRYRRMRDGQESFPARER
jgi:hypothetical protein